MRNVVQIFALLCCFFGPLFAAESITLDDFANGSAKVKDFLTANVPQSAVASTKLEVLENGVWVALAPTKVVGDRSVYDVSPYHAIGFTARCSVSGAGSGKWYFTEAYSNKPAIAGHNHNYPLPPLLTYRPDGYNSWTEFTEISSLLMVVNQDFKYQVALPVYATQIFSTMTFYGVCAGQKIYDTINVKVPNLQPLPSNPSLYTLFGSTPAHTNNHNGTKEMNAALTELAKNWKKTCPKATVIAINDMALPWGGKFDIGQKWTIGDHKDHNYGVTADLRKWNIHENNREKLVRLMCTKFLVQSEGDSVGETYHYHVRLRSAPKSMDGELEQDERATPCCVADDTPVPEQCIYLDNDGGPSDDHSDIPDTCK